MVIILNLENTTVLLICETNLYLVILSSDLTLTTSMIVSRKLIRATIAIDMDLVWGCIKIKIMVMNKIR